MRVSLRLRSIVLVLMLVSVCCSGRAINAAAALGTDTSSIQLVGSLSGSATQVQVVGTQAYVGGPDSLRIVDVHNPASLAVLGSYPSTVEDVHVVGNIAYLAGPNGLRIVSVADPAHPILRGSYDLPPIGEILFPKRKPSSGGWQRMPMSFFRRPYLVFRPIVPS